MSIDKTSNANGASPRGLRSDTLAESVVILLLMTVVQRAVGFLRGMLVCRWLDPEQLGQWDVAFGFLTLAAPLAVLGLPGSFGRYAEHYRSRGQLRLFLRRTTLVSSLMAVVAVAAMVVFRQSFSQLIFGRTDQAGLVVWIALSLAAFIVHNFLVSLFIAVRMYRVVTGLQFLHSLAFAVLSIALLAVWQDSSASVVVAFGLACVLSMGGSLAWLGRIWRDSPDAESLVPHRAFWARLVPFAVWVWVTNLLANLFEVIDRYLIIHYSALEVSEALRQVGCYHSSRLIPLLFFAIAGLLGSLVTPHLTHDWEAGRRRLVAARLNLMLKSLALAALAGAIAVLLFAPLLFEYAFRNKYADGLDLLPWTLTYCIWWGMIPIAQNYLWCAEKARLGSLAFFFGLVLNIGLSLLLLPRFGLHGAVWSTTAANLTVLAIVYAFSRASGMHIDRGTWLLTLAPLSLTLGPAAASAVLAALLLATLTSHSVFGREEKDEIRAAVGQYVARVRQLAAGGRKGSALRETASG